MVAIKDEATYILVNCGEPKKTIYGRLNIDWDK